MFLRRKCAVVIAPVAVLWLFALVAGCAEAKWPSRSEAIVPVPPSALPASVSTDVSAAGASARAASDHEPPNGDISPSELVAKTNAETHVVPGWTIQSADTEEGSEDEKPAVDFGKSARKAKLIAERNRRAVGNGGYRLSLMSMLPSERERVGLIGQSRAGELPEGLFALDTSMTFGSAASIQMKTDNRGSQRFVEDDPFRLWMDDGWDLERNRVSDSRLVIGLAEDRLRFTTRYSRSRYTASERYLRRLLKENGGGDEDSPARFDGSNRVEGDAMLNRLDLDVARGNVFRLSLFGQHSEVDPYYEDIALRDREDDFAKSNEEKDRWGGTVGLGPVALTLAQYRSRRVDILDDEGGAERTVGNEAKIEIDLSDARRRLPDMFGEATWSILPQSVWFGVDRGAVDTGLDGEPQDRTEDWNAGMSWNWDSGYGSISAWQSTYQMQQDWAKGSGSKATGVDVNFGLLRDTWGVDGYLSAGRYEYDDSYYQSGDTDLGGGVSVWAKFERFPDLSTDLYLSHYGSSAYDGSGRSVSLGRFGTLSVTADISKYLTDLPEEKRPSLQLFYRVNYDQYKDRYEADSSSSVALDHIFGMKLQMNLMLKPRKE